MAETPATASETALLGREAEQAAIERAVAQARLGRSETLVLSGEPGIGKTALLCWAEERARAERMEVLAARGVESETGVPFGGLLELLRPALEEIGQIPPAQAEALRGALDLGPSAERDRFLVGAATLNLLSARSAGVPLLVIVDDAHWLDDSSLAAILFAARRLVVDPVAVLFAMRPEQSPRLDAARLPQLPLTGVDAEAAAAIVAANAATAPPRKSRGGSVPPAAATRSSWSNWRSAPTSCSPARSTYPPRPTPRSRGSSVAESRRYRTRRAEP